MDTKGACHSVRIIRVSVLSRLSEKTSGTHVRAEDGTARSKQTTSKRKKVKSNDYNKKPRKCNVCNRRQKTLLKDYTWYKSQTLEERQTVQNQIFHAASVVTGFVLVLKLY